MPRPNRDLPYPDAQRQRGAFEQRGWLRRPSAQLASAVLLAMAVMSCSHDNAKPSESTKATAGSDRLETLPQTDATSRPNSAQSAPFDLDALLSSIPEDTTALRQRMEREWGAFFEWETRSEGKVMVVQMSFQKKLRDSDLIALAGLSGPLDVHLTATAMSNDGLALLAGLRNRQRQGRPGLGEIWGLSLGYTKVSDAGLVHLSALDTLQTLDLTRTDVSDEGLAALAKLTKLRQLVLARTRVQGRGLTHLRPLVALQELDLERTFLDDDGLHQLPALPQLRKLVLRGTRLSDAGLERLKELPNLEELDVTDTRITDGCVSHLKQLHKLRRLRIVDNTGLTERGAIQLRLALPDNVQID